MEEDLNFDGEEELVAVIPSQQNCKGIGISILVILSVIGLVALSVALITPADTGPRIKGARLHLENITSGAFQPNTFNATWFSSNQVVYTNPERGLQLLNLRSGDRRTIVSPNVFRTLGSLSYSLSPSRAWVLLQHHTGRGGSKYSLQELSKGSAAPLLRVGVGGVEGWQDQEVLQSVSWAGQQGQALLLVRGADLYYRAEADSAGPAVRLTRDGQGGQVLNGLPDWLYRGSSGRFILSLLILN